MASQTLSSIENVWPVGTTVGAYPKSNWLQNQLPPSGAAQSSASSSAAVASDGTVAFTGLADQTAYYAAASVSGTWRYREFSTPAAAAGGGGPSGSAGGDLGGTYPNPTVPGLAGKQATLTATGDVPGLTTALAAKVATTDSRLGVPAWAASTTYSTNQAVRFGGRVWTARGAFTSGTVFDPKKWNLASGGMNTDSLFRGLTPMVSRTPTLNGPASNGTSTTDQDYLIGHTVFLDGVVERVLFSYVTLTSSTPPAETESGFVPVTIYKAALEYGSVIYRLTFNGRRSVVIDPGGSVMSDAITLPVVAGQTLRSKAHLVSAAAGTGDITTGSAVVANVARSSFAEFQVGQTLTGTGIPASTTILSRTNTSITMSANATATTATLAITANGKFGRGIVANTTVDGVSNTTTDNTDVLATPTPGGGGQQAFGPAAILGTPKAGPKPIVGIAGDSIDYGTAGANTDESFITNALKAANLPTMQCAIGGDRASQYAAGQGRQRLTLLKGCTSVLLGWQTNDLAVGGRTVAQYQADLLSIATILAGWGIKVFTRTDSPRPGAATQAKADRITINNWKRDGHPIDATTLAAVATGTSSNVLRSGDPGHPIGALPFEIADSWETARDSGVWNVSYDSGDGVHPNTAGHTAAQAVIAARITEFV